MSDLHVIADVLLASLLAPALRLIVMKGIVEPAAGWAGRRGWDALDRLLHDRLPDLP
jgi:membrane glycosyltransferase